LQAARPRLLTTLQALSHQIPRERRGIIEAGNRPFECLIINRESIAAPCIGGGRLGKRRGGITIERMWLAAQICAAPVDTDGVGDQVHGEPIRFVSDLQKVSWLKEVSDDVLRFVVWCLYLVRSRINRGF